MTPTCPKLEIVLVGGVHGTAPVRASPSSRCEDEPVPRPLFPDFDLSSLREGGPVGPRTLFLDFDGVLMPSPPRIGYPAFVWLPRLHALLAPHPDVRIVLHTSWRLHQSVDHMSSQLQTLMPRVAGAISGDARYPGIAAWVAHHRPVVYLILDDQAAEYPDPAPAELVLCDPRLGITDPRASGALRRWLGATTSGAPGKR